MNPQVPSITVIVPTYNRGRVLLETIQSILGQQFPIRELVIVDQSESHDDSVLEELEALVSQGRIVWIREAIPNLPRARNIGLLHATGEIVVYLDDDVLLPRGFIARHAARYKRRNIHAVTGMILHPGEKYHDRPRLDIHAKKAARRLDMQTMRFRTRLRNPSHFVGANMSFRRKTLLQLGGFSHRFEGSALGEDMELAGRLHRNGYTSIYDPKCFLLHRVVETGGCRDRNLRSFARSRSRLRNYYYAMWHGLSPSHAAVATLRRWSGRFVKKSHSRPIAPDDRT